MVASNEAFAKGLTSVDKLAGKSVGITQVGSSFHYQIGQIATAKVKASAFFVKDKARFDVNDIAAQVAWMRENKLVDAGVDAKKLIDLSFIEANK